MGTGSSKEVVLPVSPQASSAYVQAQQEAQSDYSRRQVDAQAAYREAEDKIFREGYKRGSEDSLNKIDEEVERHARAAYAHTVLEEEQRRQAIVDREVQRLSKTFYKAPQKPVQCQQEEAAVLACDPNAPGSDGCREVFLQYELCADKVLNKLMRPSLK